MNENQTTVEKPKKWVPIVYWLSTGLLSLMMLYSVYAYLTSPAMVDAFHHLGFPDYFRKELAIAKGLGVIALLLPGGGRLKEWAYAGFSISFVSAVIAHLSSGDGAEAAAPVVALVLLSASLSTYQQVRASRS
jgi:DoxX-like family